MGVLRHQSMGEDGGTEEYEKFCHCTAAALNLELENMLYRILHKHVGIYSTEDNFSKSSSKGLNSAHENNIEGLDLSLYNYFGMISPD